MKDMSADGLVQRIDFMAVPPHVEYETTVFGTDLCRSLELVCEWGARNIAEITAIAEARAGRERTNR